MDNSYKIPAAEPQILLVGTGAEARNIAFVAAMAEWAAAHGLSSTRFD